MSFVDECMRKAGGGFIRNFMNSLWASDFVHKVAETFATRILTLGIGLIVSVVVARILGPEGRGLYAVAVAVGAIGVQFGNMGLHASNTYLVAKDHSVLSSLVGNSLFVGLVLGGLGAALALAVFLNWPDIAPIHGGLLRLALLSIPLGLSYLLLQNLLLGIHEVRTYNKIELFGNIASVIFIILLILSRLVTVETVFSVSLIILIIYIVLALRVLRCHFQGLPHLSFALFKRTLGYGLKAYLAAFFAFLVLRVDLLMVQYMLGAKQAGYYSIAVAMADLIFMLPVVVGTILFPKLSALEDTQEKLRLAKQTAWGVGFVMATMTILAAALAGPMIRWLFGQAFMPAVPAFIWLMPAIMTLSINTVLMNYFASTGMPMITIYSSGAAAILNVVLNMKLIPLLGIVGASISSIFSYGSMLAATTIYILSSRKY